MDLWPPFPLPTPEAALRDAGSRSPKARERAALALGDLEPAHPSRPRAVDTLSSLLRDPAAGVRSAAALSLGRLHAEGALDDLARLAGDPDPSVVQDVCIALSELGDPGALPVIRPLLRSEHADIRYQAVLCLARVAPDKARAGLEQALSDADPEIRQVAAACLGDLADPGSCSLLRTALADPDPEVSFESAKSLARLKDPSGLAVLAGSLSDRELAEASARYLALIGDASCLPALRRVVRSWWFPFSARVWAAGAAARLADPEGARFLLRYAPLKGIKGGLARMVCGELAIETVIQGTDDAARS